MANEAVVGFDEAVVIWDLGGIDEFIIGTAAMPVKGGSTARYEQEFWGPTYDLYGTAPVDQVKVGETATATVNMAGINLGLFADLFPAAKAVVKTLDTVAVRFGGRIGEDLSQYAKTLTFRPKSKFELSQGKAGGSAAQDVTFLKALPRANMEINFAPQTEQTYAVEFVGLVDRELGKIIAFGDNTAEEAEE